MTVKWIGKRMMMGWIVLLIVSFLSFFIMHASPGSPATAYYGGSAQTLTEVEKERIIHAFALDRPLYVQYVAWVGETVQGNLGYSAGEGRPVATILKERFPNTLALSGISMALIIIGSFGLGIAAGMKPGSWLDKGLSTASIASSAIPPFWLGILFIFLFSIKFHMFPSSGSKNVAGDGGLWDFVHHLFLPVSVLFFSHVGMYARFLQDGIKAELKSYYVMVARANGVKEKEISRGIVKNALIPYVNYIGITIPSFFGGSIIVESLFNWPGLGQLMVNSVMTKDFPVLMGSILVTGVTVVISLFLIDVWMYYLSPKLRKGGVH